MVGLQLKRVVGSVKDQKNSSYTTTLTSAECQVLRQALQKIPWWEVRTHFGVSAQIARRAARGEEILTTTAALLRQSLSHGVIESL